jgi:uncharacterized protein YkwD
MVIGALALWMAIGAPTALATDAPSRTSAGSVALLARYQQALDQIAQGRLAEARAILSEGTKRYGQSPETAALLAYLLQRDGQFEEARKQLQSGAESAMLAPAYLTQLRGLRDTVTPLPDSRAPARTDRSSKPAATRVEQSDARLEKLEKAMIDLVNADRKKAGLSSLQYSGDLAAVARAHSAEMRDLKYFAHESPTDSLREPMDRYLAALERTPHIVAENIYRVWGSRHRLEEQDVITAQKALMNSPGHRANILMPEVRRIGIGIVANDNGDLWLTQMFDRP